MNLNDAERWYDKAYTLHYKDRDLEGAYYYYRYIVQHFSDSKEARYARQQIENLKSTNVLTDEIIASTEDRLQNLGTQEAPTSKAEDHFLMNQSNQLRLISLQSVLYSIR